ncbi:MAG: urease accessory UreF family protein [Candidatus Dasytiphilus stammeri]
MHVRRLMRLIQFADSFLPVGSFSFSNGIETAIQYGVVNDIKTLKDFTYTTLLQNARCDCRAIRASCIAIKKKNYKDLINYDSAVFNRKINEENRTMIVRMGKKFIEMAVQIIEEPLFIWWLDLIKTGKTVGTYPITQSIIMSRLEINSREIIVMYQYGIAIMMLSAALRLMRITHITIQKILYEMSNHIDKFCHEAEQGNIENMNNYAPITDILASLHVKAFTRLFSN